MVRLTELNLHVEDDVGEEDALGNLTQDDVGEEDALGDLTQDLVGATEAVDAKDVKNTLRDLRSLPQDAAPQGTAKHHAQSLLSRMAPEVQQVMNTSGELAQVMETSLMQSLMHSAGSALAAATGMVRAAEGHSSGALSHTGSFEMQSLHDPRRTHTSLVFLTGGIMVLFAVLMLVFFVQTYNFRRQPLPTGGPWQSRSTLAEPIEEGNETDATAVYQAGSEFIDEHTSGNSSYIIGQVSTVSSEGTSVQEPTPSDGIVEQLTSTGGHDRQLGDLMRGAGGELMQKMLLRHGSGRSRNYTEGFPEDARNLSEKDDVTASCPASYMRMRPKEWLEWQRKDSTGSRVDRCETWNAVTATSSTASCPGDAVPPTVSSTGPPVSALRKPMEGAPSGSKSPRRANALNVRFEED